MAGPQVQHSQRPTSAYYTGLNGSSGIGNNTITTSASHTGLHALRQVSNENELIYRGSNGNTVTDACAASTSRAVIQRQPQSKSTNSINVGNVVSVSGSGPGCSDALIVNAANSRKALSNSQRSIEIVVDDTQCGKSDDVEQGQTRKASRHRHRPLHRRFISYLRSLFQGSTAQTDSELEEFETPARYRPDSLSALSRATRFTEDEIKRIYRGFKAECPTGVVKEDTFKVIYSQFFPQGANPTLYAHYVFNTLDQHHSGIVSFELKQKLAKYIREA
ncbi:uncharacterized protein LOC119666405 [Teleopsis dalmanni]|uniref:uncharacterized protein LOC119666405 n=1 Tax=Teleopsis dalmanni TaxID=139649 RepID=UPI0018CCD758|nr:uncharacterized protein LOC119666405 [Teleopsis dalmanni]